MEIKTAKLIFDPLKYQDSIRKIATKLFVVSPSVRYHRLSDVSEEFKYDTLFAGYIIKDTKYSWLTIEWVIDFDFNKQRNENSRYKIATYSYKNNSYLLAAGHPYFYEHTERLATFLGASGEQGLVKKGIIYQFKDIPFKALDELTTFLSCKGNIEQAIRETVALEEEKEKQEILLYKKLKDEREKTEKKILSSLKKLAS